MWLFWYATKPVVIHEVTMNVTNMLDATRKCLLITGRWNILNIKYTEYRSWTSTERHLLDADDQNDCTDDIELCVIWQIPTPKHALCNNKTNTKDLVKFVANEIESVMQLTISSTGNSVLMYSTFLHQYFGQLTWSIVGGSNTDSCSKYFIETSTSPSTNMYGAVKRTNR